jgi:phosphomannomutase/phosphoglucomutase
VSIGRDVRLTSERIKNALIRGILSTGLNTVDIGICPTPVVYFSIVHLETDGSVMITGSHNPIEFNGLKMNEGIPSLYGDDILALRTLIENQDFEKGAGTQSEKDILPDYKNYILENIHLERPLKLIIDAGNGTAGPIAPELYRKMGCDVYCLFCDPDGRFPNHLPDPTVLDFIKDLREKVVNEKADLGLGYDGDSDRVGVIDEKGNVVFADQLLALLSKEVLKKHPGTEIPFDVKCSQLVPEVIKESGGVPLMWKTGHSLIKAKMREVGAQLAGEMSGHIFYKDGYFGFDDGIYTSFRLVQLLASQNKTMSELIAELPSFVATPEIRITCADDVKFDVIDQLIQSFKEKYEVIDVDGARVEFGDGWGLVRASNTQPVLVLRFEARTEERLEEIKSVFREALSAYEQVNVEELDAGGVGH